MTRSARIDRRNCLKGLGVSLALPLMESMGWADTAKGKPYKPPVRLGFMYMPHGVIMDQFWPKDAESFLSSPPPDVPALDQQDSKAVATLTVRERTELHRTNPVCANCHKVLDPIGFGLQNFDAVGRWRDLDSNGKPVDAAGELPTGEKFASPKDLKSILAGRPEAVTRNLVEKLLAYALGRRLEGYDEIVVDDVVREVAGDGYRMQTLIRGVVTSYPFTHRRVGRKEDIQ